MGIDSVIAIPIENWSLDYITPHPECVRKNGVCLPTTYPDAPDPAETAVIPFRPPSPDDGTGQEQPQLLYVDGTSDIEDIKGRVPKPGLYVLVAQYKQDNPGEL